MSNSGNPEPDNQVTSKRGGWVTILAAGLLLVIGVALVTQFVPVLYAVFFPPTPPRPDNTIEISRDSAGYGEDTFLYSSPDDGCALTRYYQSQGASCNIAPTVCTSGFVELTQPRAGAQVSRCSADVDFSIFTMRYRVEISAGYEGQTESLPTRLRVEREIFWADKPRTSTSFTTTLTP